MERVEQEDTWPVEAGTRLLGGDVCACVLYIFVRMHVCADLLALSCCQQRSERSGARQSGATADTNNLSERK